jgi:N-carbamoylputrescine amidase
VPKLAIAQIHCAPEIETNLFEAEKRIAEAAAAGASLICFPEVQLSPFFAKHKGGEASAFALKADGPEITRLQEAAKAHTIVVVANIYLDDSDGHRYDASPVIDSDGTLLGLSRMNEVAQFDGFWEQDYYAPGEGFDVYDTSAGKVGIVICFDRHFPESYRIAALKSAQIIATPTCIEFGEPLDLFEAEMRTLAFHNSVYALLANRCGDEEGRTYAGQSMILDPKGEVLAKAGETPQLLLADYDLDFQAEISRMHGFVTSRTASGLG